jgi:esterase/lipase
MPHACPEWLSKKMNEASDKDLRAIAEYYEKLKQQENDQCSAKNAMAEVISGMMTRHMPNVQIVSVALAPAAKSQTLMKRQILNHL